MFRYPDRPIPLTNSGFTEGGQDYLGLGITGDAAQGWVHVSQETYAKKVVEKFGFSDSQRVPTPMGSRGGLVQ